MKLKYIIVDYNGIELPIIFNGTIMTHDSVYRFNDQIVSAGFCSYWPEDGGWRCYGESVSTGKKSRPEDSKILNQHCKI